MLDIRTSAGGAVLIVEPFRLLAAAIRRRGDRAE